jgi:hypothetical protein
MLECVVWGVERSLHYLLVLFFVQTALLGGASALDLAQLLRNQWAEFLRGGAPQQPQ